MRKRARSESDYLTLVTKTLEEKLQKEVVKNKVQEQEVIKNLVITTATPEIKTRRPLYNAQAIHTASQQRQNIYHQNEQLG